MNANVKIDLWDDYARLFSAITSRFQQEMYELAASHLAGSVLDGGCGAAKLLPYVAASPDVVRYTGVDSSPQMIARARLVLEKFPDVDAQVLLQSIEETRGRFDSVVSLQSYYSWSDGAAILEHVRGLVGAGGTFVLASANETLDIEKLLDVASRELLMHPDWDDFARINRALAGTGTGNFVSLDTLIREARAARFGVREAHTELYAGGLNFLVLAT